MSAELGLLRKLLPSEPRHPNYLVANGECRSEICIGWIEQTRNVLVSKWSEPLFFTLDRPLRFCCKRCKNPFAQVKPQRPFVWTTRRDTMKTRLVPAVFLSDCLSNTRKIPVDFVQTNTKKERERERKRERERELERAVKERQEALCCFVAIVVVYYSSSGEPSPNGGSLLSRKLCQRNVPLVATLSHNCLILLSNDVCNANNK